MSTALRLTTEQEQAYLSDYPYFDTIEQAENYMASLSSYDGRPRRVHKSRSLKKFFVLVYLPASPSSKGRSERKAERIKAKPQINIPSAFEPGVTVCWLCENPIVFTDKRHSYGYSEDHIIPKSHGGTRESTNIKPAHRACNIIRGNADVTDAVRNICKQRYIEFFGNRSVDNR